MYSAQFTILLCTSTGGTILVNSISPLCEFVVVSVYSSHHSMFTLHCTTVLLYFITTDNIHHPNLCQIDLQILLSVYIIKFACTCWYIRLKNMCFLRILWLSFWPMVGNLRFRFYPIWTATHPKRRRRLIILYKLFSFLN